MSTESLSPQDSALLARIELIEGDAAAMKVAHNRSRLARLVLLLMLALAAVVFVYLFLSLATRFTDSGRQRNFAATALNQFFEVVDVDQRAKAESAEDWEELLNQYSEMLVNEVQDLGKTSMPIVQEAFSEQIRKDMPKHRAMFEEQRDLLMSNLQEQGDALLQARYQKVLDKHKAILQSEFDGLDDEKMETMLAHINIAMDRLLTKYYSDEIEGQFNQLRQTFDDFAVSDPPTGGETLNQQLLGTSVELLTVKFVGDPIVEQIESDSAADDTEVASTEAVEEDKAEAEDKSEEGKEVGSEDVALVKTDADEDEREEEAEQDDAKQEDAKQQDEPKQDDAEDADDASDEKGDGKAEDEQQESEEEAEPES